MRLAVLPALAPLFRSDQNRTATPIATSPEKGAKKSDNADGSSRPKRHKRRLRTIFLSDIHLGTRGCRADILLDFLRHHEAAQIYLVGDIVDGWRLQKSWYWPKEHSDFVRKLLKRAARGVDIVYIPGNHDEAFRDYVGLDFAGIRLCEDAVHVAADGRRYWVLHGDAFDGIVLYARWLAFLGDTAYTLLLSLNTVLNRARRRLGLPYWSLSAWLKHKTKKAVAFMARFEDAVAREAAARGVDGVICGHIHHAETRMIGDVLYCNDGDWVESCTALVEHEDGRMEIIRWADVIGRRANDALQEDGHAAERIPA